MLSEDIKRHDQGIYRCRIDFRTSQTQSFRFNLSVIILPEQPIILDRWGRQLNGTKLGPKQEGDDIVITCRVVGGRPQPQVRWLVNGLLVDNQYEHNSGDVIENRLLWPSVQRTDLNSVFTCQALNTQLDKPKEKSFILDMHLKPLEVKIIEPPSSMVADRRYEVTCESTGSRPNAIITWYKGKRQLRRTKDEVSNNTTRSELSFVPTTDDDGKSITCRAENPNVNGLYLETMWKLNVVYPPLVTLRLGSTLSPDDIKEGDDVYFECHVQSNPQWRKLLWLHNDRFSKIYVHMCRRIYVIYKGIRNIVGSLQRYGEPFLYATTFRWKFNNSGETLDVGSERFSVNGSRSILKYTPVTDQIFMMTFLHNLRRNRQHGTKATATAVVTQTGDVYKGGVGIEKPRWQHTDIKSKSSEDLVEDERDPDVIPSQYVGSVGSDGSTSSSASVSIGGASSGGGSGGVGVTNNISNGATNGSVNHHFSTTSKWSPSSNQHANKSFESNMMQQSSAGSNSVGVGGGGGVGGGSDLIAATTTVALPFNQINTRTHLIAAISVLSPTNTGAAVTTTSPAALLHNNTNRHISSGGGDEMCNIIGSPTSLASTSTIAATTHLQQQLHSSGVGTLPPGLGSGGGYILNSLINSSSGTAMSSLHHTTSNNSGVGGSIGRVNLHHHHHHTLHHSTLGARGNASNNSQHYAGHSPSMMLTSQTTSALSTGGSTPGSGSAVGLLLGSSHPLSSTGASASTATTSCNSSTDLDDNINIMAIKDCLMTQRVPESCV
uniref:Ig-like domain-containing protein n=1 Tax=Glossina morsitans morsitans TaxID=37546 RepID=A0A1B0FLW0_GLOMM